MDGPPVVLVNESSATHGRPGEDLAHHVQGINRTHSDLIKFGRQDQEYYVVLGFLLDFADSAEEVVRRRFRDGLKRRFQEANGRAALDQPPCSGVNEN
jgi:hypothetical protein